MDKDYIRSVVEFVASGNTIEEASLHFGKSASSIKKYLAKFRDETSRYYDPILAERLKLSQMKTTLEGQKKGGSIGKRGKSYDDFTARMYAEAYMSGLTLRELAEISGIPKTTLHEMIRGIDDKELQLKINDYISRDNEVLIDPEESESVKWKR